MPDFTFSQWCRFQDDDSITIYDNDLARASSIQEAVFTRRLLWLWSRFKSENGMFVVAADFYEPIGMSRHSFRKIVNIWKENDLIRTDFRGAPPKTFYFLNEDKIAKYLNTKKKRGMNLRGERIKSTSPQPFENEQLNVRKRTDVIKRNNKSELNKRPVGNKIADQSEVENKKKADWPIIEEGKDQQNIHAKRLAKILQNAKRIKRRFSSTAWSNTLAKISTKDGHTEKEVSFVLDFLEENIHGQYTPQVFSATSFREKFPALLTAAKKAGFGSEQKPITGRAIDLARKASNTYGMNVTPQETTLLAGEYTEIVTWFRKQSPKKTKAKALRKAILDAAGSAINAWDYADWRLLEVRLYGIGEANFNTFWKYLTNRIPDLKCYETSFEQAKREFA